MPQQVIPIPKVGPFCPSGYRADGGTCVPQNSSTKAAIVKVGPFCPSGYRADGKYCVEQ